MLAQNFKTPADLKISDTEFEALVKVLGMLERGEITSGKAWAAGAEIPTSGLWMSMQYHRTDCGTVACIGGWVAILMQHHSPVQYVNAHHCRGPLDELYWNWDALSRCASPAQAAIAVRNFLNSGEPRWFEALSER